MPVTFNNINEAIEILGPRIVNSSISSAVNKASTKIKTTVSKEIRKNFYIKASDVKPHIKLIKASPQRTSSVISITGKPIPLKYFNAKPGKRNQAGATVKIKKRTGREIVDGAFIVNKYRDNVFKREGPDRFPIEKQYGPSIVDMILDSNVLNRIVEDINTRVPAAIRHELEFRVNRSLNRAYSRTNAAR